MTKAADILGQYQDATNRVLVVDTYNPGARDGRVIVGTIHRATQIGVMDGEPYACDEQIFRDIWVEKAPRWTGNI